MKGTIFVASGKGGVGKTSLVAGIGSCLAAMGLRVLCIDADFGLGNLDILFGLTDKTALDLGDVLRGHAGLMEAAVRHSEIEGLYLLNAPLRMDGIEERSFVALERFAAREFDYCFVDCSAGIGRGLEMAARGADMGIIVASPDFTSLRDAERAARICEDVGHKGLELKLVINRVRPKLMATGDMPNIDDAMDATGLPLLGVVPEDERVIASSNRSEPLVLNHADGASAAYLRIARRLTGARVALPQFD